MSKQLIYFADPMCSWCWGFAPTITAIESHFGPSLPIRIIMGGLRPGTTRPMREKDKTYIREHWEHVHKMTDQPFDFTFFEREGFVYDTEPAARAVIAVRRLAPASALTYLKFVQQAFYAEGRDTTDAQVLAELAGDLGLDPDAVMREWQSELAIEATRADFTITRKTGINGFPALLAGIDGEAFKLVTTGYQSWDDMEPALTHWFETGQ